MKLFVRDKYQQRCHHDFSLPISAVTICDKCGLIKYWTISAPIITVISKKLINGKWVNDKLD